MVPETHDPNYQTLAAVKEGNGVFGADKGAGQPGAAGGGPKPPAAGGMAGRDTWRGREERNHCLQPLTIPTIRHSLLAEATVSDYFDSFFQDQLSTELMIRSWNRPFQRPRSEQTREVEEVVEEEVPRHPEQEEWLVCSHNLELSEWFISATHDPNYQTLAACGGNGTRSSSSENRNRHNFRRGIRSRQGSGCPRWWRRRTQAWSWWNGW